MERLSFEAVVQRLRADPAIARCGFAAGGVCAQDGGANHRELMVITKPAWTIPAAEPVDGYRGVNVHLVSDRAGALQVNCVLHPRQGSEEDADPERIGDLLRLKAAVAVAMRAHILRYGLARHGVNLHRIHRDPADPASAKVMGFDLGPVAGEGAGEGAEEYAAAVVPVIEAVTPLIDEVVGTFTAPYGWSCPACGASAPDAGTYCAACGRRLAETPAPMTLLLVAAAVVAAVVVVAVTVT